MHLYEMPVTGGVAVCMLQLIEAPLYFGVCIITSCLYFTSYLYFWVKNVSKNLIHWGSEFLNFRQLYIVSKSTS